MRNNIKGGPIVPVAIAPYVVFLNTTASQVNNTTALIFDEIATCLIHSIFVNNTSIETSIINIYGKYKEDAGPDFQICTQFKIGPYQQQEFLPNTLLTILPNQSLYLSTDSSNHFVDVVISYRFLSETI